MFEEQMRAEFETWWKQTLLIKHELSIREIVTYCERSPDGDYVHTATALRWDGWKAALAHQASDERVRKLEKDAARYRWILHNTEATDALWKYGIPSKIALTERHINNAIDQAIASWRENRND